MEHNQKAADGTVYDNGYGIMLIIRGTYTSGYWNTENTTAGGYLNSLAHSKTNQIATNIKNNILGTHLVNRNVLLSSSVDSSTGMASAATWTTAYGTLPSLGQFFGAYRYAATIYDDGEANYMLPISNYNYITSGVDRWFRNINAKSNSDYTVFYLKSLGTMVETCAANSSSKYYYPLLYIR